LPNSRGVYTIKYNNPLGISLNKLIERSIEGKKYPQKSTYHVKIKTLIKRNILESLNSELHNITQIVGEKINMMT
jgi:hypothetical protein